MEHTGTNRSKHALLAPVLICLAITLVGALALIIAVGGRDTLPPADGDLAVERPAIADEANAFTAFNAAAETYDSSRDGTVFADYILGNPVDTNALKAVIAGNDASYALIRRGTACSYCIVPQPPGIDIAMPYLLHWGSLSRLIRVKGDLALSEGDYAEAAETSVTLIRFGALIQQYPETLIQYFIGRSILDLGLAASVKLARDPGVPTETLRMVAQAIAQVPSSTNSLIRAMKGEYRLASLALDAINARTTPSPILSWATSTGGVSKISSHPFFRYLMQPNKTKQIYAEQIRETIDNAPRCYADMTLPPRPSPSRVGRALFYVRPNGVGKMTLQLMYPVLDTQLERLCANDSDLAAARLIVALHLHRRMHGTFPAELAALVPDELAVIPTDPFDGKPFRYDPEQGILYSVGKNLVDDGGSTTLLKGRESDPEHRRRWNAEDAVYRIESTSTK